MKGDEDVRGRIASCYRRVILQHPRIHRHSRATALLPAHLCLDVTNQSTGVPDERRVHALRMARGSLWAGHHDVESPDDRRRQSFDRGAKLHVRSTPIGTTTVTLCWTSGTKNSHISAVVHLRSSHSDASRSASTPSTSGCTSVTMRLSSSRSYRIGCLYSSETVPSRAIRVSFIASSHYC